MTVTARHLYDLAHEPRPRRGAILVLSDLLECDISLAERFYTEYHDNSIPVEPLSDVTPTWAGGWARLFQVLPLVLQAKRQDDGTWIPEPPDAVGWEYTTVDGDNVMDYFRLDHDNRTVVPVREDGITPRQALYGGLWSKQPNE